MKNQESPFSLISSLEPLEIGLNKLNQSTVQYAPNEFTDLTDPIGFMEEEKPAFEYLTRYG